MAGDGHFFFEKNALPTSRREQPLSVSAMAGFFLNRETTNIGTDKPGDAPVGVVCRAFCVAK